MRSGFNTVSAIGQFSLINLLISFTGCLDQPLGQVARASDCPDSLNLCAASRANGSAMVGVFWVVALVLHHKLVVCRNIRGYNFTIRLMMWSSVPPWHVPHSLRGWRWWERWESLLKAREGTRATWLVSGGRHQGLWCGGSRACWMIRGRKLTRATCLVAAQACRHQRLWHGCWWVNLLVR